MFSFLSFEKSTEAEIHQTVGRAAGSKNVRHTVEQKKVKDTSFYGIKSRSRNGCLQCKKAKKRCDQVKPRCSLCSKRNTPSCVYPEVMHVSNNQYHHHQMRTLPQPLDEASDIIEVQKDSPTQAAFNMNDAATLTVRQPFTRTWQPVLSYLMNGDHGNHTDGSLHIVEETVDNNSNNDNDNDDIAPLDETLVVENIENRTGSLNENDYLDLLLDIMKDSSDSSWVNPAKRDMLKYLKSSYKSAHQISRNPTSSNAISLLDDVGLLFFEHYRSCVGHGVSVSPRDSDNYFINFFLPLAEKHPSVLYAVTGWGGFALAGSSSDVSRGYFNKATKELESKVANLEKEIAKPVNQRKISNDDLFAILAVYLISTGAEISTGDVQRWTQHMKAAFKILSTIGLKNLVRQNVGGSDFKAMLWFISNFFYHDVRYFSNKQTMFAIEDYKEVLAYSGHLAVQDTPLCNSAADYGVDPLNGCNLALILIEGQIVNAYHEFTEELSKLNELYKIDWNMSAFLQDHNTNFASIELQKQQLYMDLEAKCAKLEAEIDSAKPSKAVLALMDAKAVELHLTVFDLLQITLKLFLNLLLRRKPPRSKAVQENLAIAINDFNILLGNRLELSLAFPVVVVALSCYKDYDRFQMNKILTTLVTSGISLFSFSVFERAQVVINRYWDLNPDGELTVNWYDILNQMGWELSLA